MVRGEMTGQATGGKRTRTSACLAVYTAAQRTGTTAGLTRVTWWQDWRDSVPHSQSVRGRGQR